MNKELERLCKDIETEQEHTNHLIEEVGLCSDSLRKQIKSIQGQFDMIRGKPSELQEECKKTKIIIDNWEKQVQAIEEVARANPTRVAELGAVGIGFGVATATLAPSVAMGLVTTFGVASTGTAISSLSGAAATNAALAILGGGTLAAGGAGVAGGKLLLALAGPVGWGIAAISFLISLFFLGKFFKEKKRAEEIMILCSENRLKHFKLANVELNERISRIKKETELLHEASYRIVSFGIDYSSMTCDQKKTLGVYVNLMFASAQLLTTPISSLQPKFNESDYDYFVYTYRNDINNQVYRDNKNIIIYYANVFHGIDMSYDDYKLMWKLYRSSKEELNRLGISKEDFVEDIFHGVQRALDSQTYRKL